MQYRVWLMWNFLSYKNFQLSDGFLMILWFNVVKENPKEVNEQHPLSYKEVFSSLSSSIYNTIQNFLCPISLVYICTFIYHVVCKAQHIFKVHSSKSLESLQIWKRTLRVTYINSYYFSIVNLYSSKKLRIQGDIYVIRKST